MRASRVNASSFEARPKESISMMHAYGRKFIGEGDEIIISAMEHHANIVPWQMLCEEKGARLRVIPMNDAGEVVLGEVKGVFEREQKTGGGARGSHPLVH